MQIPLQAFQPAHMANQNNPREESIFTNMLAPFSDLRPSSALPR
jgi:hypothetical protein